MRTSPKVGIALAVVVLLGIVAAASGYVGVHLGRHYDRNKYCCQMYGPRTVVLSFREMLGVAPTYHGQLLQDKWIAEKVFPGVRDGFFVDVGSADGVKYSNTKALEARGWRGICIDPFPTNMEGRTCQMFKEVVYSEAGKEVKFRAAGILGGIEDSLKSWKEQAMKAEMVTFTTVTLGDILERGKAPANIHYISLDIEGAELDALRGFPFEKYKVGAWTIEHNYEEPKRTQIRELLESKGYRAVHGHSVDDYYLHVELANVRKTVR